MCDGFEYGTERGIGCHHGEAERGEGGDRRVRMVASKPGVGVKIRRASKRAITRLTVSGKASGGSGRRQEFEDWAGATWLMLPLVRYS